MISSIKNFVLKEIVLTVIDIQSLIHLKQLHNQYLPWTGYSIRPTAMRYILNDIIFNDRNIIVECGAGVSTIYVASLLKQLGNKEKKLYSIDHDKNWLTILQRDLDKNSLSEYVTLIHAPLEHSEYCLNDNLLWYSKSNIESALDDNKIDLLFVDGPPANNKGLELSRYPAYPCFKDRLSDKSLVILDDATRKGEETIAKKWSEISGLTFTRSILSGNIYTGLSGDSYNVL